ncbi:MAG TPA: twin-arginine translocase subunit TatC [Anaeromyxobacteraceae bacterium]|nr:twin-arginine translocase subunit TatC [Anaeromyxobacteraceae bacterium]
MSAAAAPPSSPPPPPEGEVQLTFMDHLRELRRRLTQALYGIALGMLALGVFVERIFHLLMDPVLASLPKEQQTLQYTSYVEPLMVYLKVALYGGLFVAAPWVLFQLWLFIAPGLYKREKKVVIPFLAFGTTLFYAGAAFCYFLVMPAAFPAMAAIASDAALRPMLTMSETLSLVLAMLLGFGLVFELPVVIAFLAMIGVVSADTLAKNRRVAIIVNVAVAAIITPTGDPLNLAMMALPMIVFYEVGVIAARILGKKRSDGDALAKA